MLPPLEGGYLEEKAPPSDKGPVIHPEVIDLDAIAQRDMARVREMAACNITQATTIPRLQRAHTHKTMSSLERFENQPGDLVDIWYEPTRNDHGGWRGPATIKTINEEHSQVVKIQENL